jgi:hypothetical protein
VREPAKAFSALIEQLREPSGNLARALEANQLKRLQDTPNRHGWQGRPGLWRELVLPVDAVRIFRYHRNVFGAWLAADALSLEAAYGAKELAAARGLN